ncbi:hypothetical protein E2C01_048615 [Portunus trituberculatus]|uniref:Uncharacterized protein n=1 Tax=Portunus trituberculatus TaxID=210409 RepID=A0A5B7G4A2_PORTR|nr:hypothetical protein [Portunus trituberculatus]
MYVPLYIKPEDEEHSAETCFRKRRTGSLSYRISQHTQLGREGKRGWRDRRGTQRYHSDANHPSLSPASSVRECSTCSESAKCVRAACE